MLEYTRIPHLPAEVLFESVTEMVGEPGSLSALIHVVTWIEVPAVRRWKWMVSPEAAVPPLVSVPRSDHPELLGAHQRLYPPLLSTYSRMYPPENDPISVDLK